MSFRRASTFREYIDEVLQGADVLLCVMSDKWLGKRRKGVSRIMDPADPIRVEIEAALRKKKIPVVPILVDDMSMPGQETFQTRFRISDSETRFCSVNFMTSTRMQIALSKA